MDLCFQVARLPAAGETLIGDDFSTSYGGKGANQALAAARLGARVQVVTRAGCDAFGDALLRNFAEHGVDTTFAIRDQTLPSGVAAIVLDRSGDNRIIVVPGANDELSAADVRAAAAAIGQASAVVCQLEIPVDSVVEAFRIARRAGVRTILNPAPAKALPAELIELTDVCVPNETEARAMAGWAHDVPIDDVVGKLLSQGWRCLIITLGGDGCLVATAETLEHVAASPVQCVDPTGAGDAFVGGLAVFLGEGCSVSQAARQASAVAALSITRRGAQAGLPDRREVEAFVQRPADK
jgi:ribokinase